MLKLYKKDVQNPEILTTVKGEVQVGEGSSLAYAKKGSANAEGSSSLKRNDFSSDSEVGGLTHEMGLSCNLLTSESEESESIRC